MAEPIIPPVPRLPTEGAPWQELDAYYRAVDVYNRSITAPRHAAAQQATADAMLASVSAQEALARVMAAPAPRSLPSRAELVWQCMQDMPQSTKDTDTAQVVAALARVDAYLAKVPNGAGP